MGRGDAGGWLSVVVLVASALCYEASLPAAALAVLVAPRLVGRRWSLRHVAALEVALVVTGLWMFANSQHRGPRFTGWFDLPSLVDAHLGEQLNHVAPLAGVLTTVGAAGITLALARPAFPSLASLPARATTLVASGLAVIAVGMITFLRYPISAVGLGDRSNVISSVGTAVVWVGVGTLVWERNRRIGMMTAALFAVVLAVGHLQRDVDYARAGDDTVRVIAAVREVQDHRPHLDVVVGPDMPTHHRIVGLIGIIDQVVPADTGDPRRRASVADGAEQFESVAPERRVDVRKVLGRS